MQTVTNRDSGAELAAPLLHHLVDEVAQRHPDQVAVVHNDQSLTYQQLVIKADALAQTILHRDTASPFIGISTTRDLSMIVGVLAILKAGKGYLPLDPSYPIARLKQIVDSAGIRTALITEADEQPLATLPLQRLPRNQTSPLSERITAQQHSTAYVLFTSGSTGTPKGVCLGQSALINLLAWQKTQSQAGIGTRTLQFAPLTFDVSFQEIFATLSTGGTLVLIDDSQRLDLNSLLPFIGEQQISRLFLPFVALQYLAEAAVTTNYFPNSLREIMTAGEQLKVTPQVVTFFTGMPGCVLFNQYGPTECHVVTQLRLDGDPATWPALPSIGSPIDNVRVHVLTDQLKPVSEGDAGELCFSGACLAEGYLNQPDLTAEKFTYVSLPGEPHPVRIYRTGDLGRLLPDGSIDFQGRRDDQVKIRGHRIELGEIEVVLNQTPGIKQAVVMARSGPAGQQLIAYLISADGQSDILAVRNAIDQRLPDYMLPSAYVWLNDFPKTSSGKVDKKRLPAPERKRPESAGPYRKPRTELEKTIERIWVSLLELDTVGLDDNFFELGGNSLLAQKTVAGLKQEKLTLPITKLYQFPTIAGVANYLQPTRETAKKVQTSPLKSQSDTSSDIAIIGMSGRFPGASSIDELWRVLSQGIETVRFFTNSELDSTIPKDLRTDSRYVKARGVLDGADQFDPAFFGIPPAIAQLMDPQQRVFLEISWETLEQTGYLPTHYDGRVGVFAGSGNNSYFLNNVQSNKELVNQVGAFQVMTLNEKDYVASRTAYQLNVKGPAVSVYSACSTSLLAVTQAVQSLRNGQCDVALAGGASITAPINSGHLYQEGAMLSKDGHCRSFDAQAQGTTFSDGAGVVLLKDAAAARRDGDTIYAVIKGVGVNNDGGGKGSFTAPSAEGQAGSIAMAIADAAIDPATISYVEAHGTATPLGDPIEIDGLTMAFGEQEQKQFCAIGSIKSNMGHLTAAAGVAGLIKTVLALSHRQIPPSLGFSTPNPAIDFANSPFFVNTKLADWPSDNPVNPRRANPHRPYPRRAGVSSFGVGGTNVHVILEEFIPAVEANQPASEPAAADRAVQLITWSAKTAKSRDAYAGKLVNFLKRTDDVNLADVAFTLQTTRAPFRHRRFAVAATTDELLKQLAAAPAAASTSPAELTTPDETVFLFPGQGAQYLNMGRALYENEAVFRDAVDRCAILLAGHLDLDIRQVLYSEKTNSESEQRLKNTRYTQPALFVTEYALATLWMSWGIEPSIFCGHSVGEFVGAHLAGVFSLADALKLIAIRGKLVSELPRGSMLSVRQPAELVQPMMPDTLSMAAANSRNLCVVAGPDEHIADFARLLDERLVPNRLLLTSHAFHSTMMEPVVGTFTEAVTDIVLNRPQKPIVSTLTGTWMTDADAVDPAYWGRHLRETVRFADALDTLFALDNPLLIDLGPGRGLATLARQQVGKKAVPIFTGLVDQLDWSACNQALLTTLGQLYVHGLNPDWQAFYGGQQRQRVLLPTYAFDYKRCWIDPVRIEPVPREPAATTVALPIAPSSELTTNLAVSTQPTQVTMRKTILIGQINDLIETASGLDMVDVTPDMSFLEIGLDSLLLTQVALTLKKEFDVPITFRQLTNDFTSPALLAEYLDQQLPAEVAPPAVDSMAAPVAPTPAAAPMPAPVYAAPPISMPATPVTADGDSALNLIAQQMQLLARQIALLQAASPAAAPAYAAPMASAPAAISASVPAPTPAPKQVQLSTPDITAEEAVELKKPFGATARIERQSTTLTSQQQTFLQQVTDRYTKKTGKSKVYAQEHRAQMADPRVVSGFRPLTKEIVYPLVVNRSKGSHLWDIDGNEYIDALNGFGSNMFGYQPDMIKKALLDQIEDGYEIGPQHPLAGEVSDLICELTGNDRAALCNTGSEAVLGAMRIARTVTGRSLIVAFSGSYHGIVDEVIVRGTKKLKSFPAAPGIMPEAVQNMLILEYGTDETLAVIRDRAHELAAVLVEPVQSRRPEFVPIDFLKKIRSITAKSGTALIFDEVITGFRMHPGGAQALFGIKADLATYGKVVGAGISIGVIAGKRDFMDALDGGFWQYGDASVPEVGVTYFAGTFVRHPLALAASKASLEYMKRKGPQLQEELTRKTKRLADALNSVLNRHQLPIYVAQFGSLWKIKFKEDILCGELLFTLMREKGIHIWDNFPCFLTEAHTDDEVNTIVRCFEQSVQELMDGGIFTGTEPAVEHTFIATPPAPGARLGRDQNGNPAWFIPNPDQAGKYLKVELN
ncbi:polyketide synthase [Spirosoma sp. KUDC1026]|uniref:polyketide synthase n=1 Tax=Spirosoma sp. KUDC1026 TaxID=2745947 RepID=UPI00159B96C6|nr:polyketide synthase [Spirosoma sp. KUDC1026]QKZ13419.1 amino acid adenylation domain-containing protein [Spirosoma sp. KUDC1026]